MRKSADRLTLLLRRAAPSLVCLRELVLFRRRVVIPLRLPLPVAGFADGFPFLMTNQASLDDLNSRLASPLPMARFRPKCVLLGRANYSCI